MVPASQQWLRTAGGVIAVVAIGVLARARFRVSRRASLATTHKGSAPIDGNTQAPSVAHAWSISAHAAF